MTITETFLFSTVYGTATVKALYSPIPGQEEIPAILFGECGGREFFVQGKPEYCPSNNLLACSLRFTDAPDCVSVVTVQAPQPFYHGLGHRLSPYLPYALVAAYADGFRVTVQGLSETDARRKMELLCAVHGDIAYYDSATDLFYEQGKIFLAVPEPPTINAADFLEPEE